MVTSYQKKSRKGPRRQQAISTGSQPLQMVFRPVETGNGWAKAQGFEILQTTSDRWGYYSVTLTQKSPAKEVV